MANGTTGLGLDQTVFDFSGIAEFGLQLDAMNEAKREKKSQKFKTQYGSKLQEKPEVTMVRDVDKEFLEASKDEYMEAATKAQLSEDPADAQRALELQSTLSRQIKESQMINEQDFRTLEVITASDDPAYYRGEWETRRKETALSKDKDFIAREDSYQYIPKKDIAPSSLNEMALQDVVLVREMGTYQHTDEKGTSVTRFQKDKAEAKANSLYDEFTKSPTNQKVVEEAYFQKRFGDIDRFTDEDVTEMNNMLNQSKDIIAEYEKIENIEKDPYLKANPAEMRRVKDLFNLPQDIDNFGRERWVNTLVEKAEVRDRTQEGRATGATTGEDGSDYGINAAYSFEGLLGEGADLSKVPDVEGMSDMALGKASTKGGTLKSIGKGKNAVYYEGITCVLSKDAEFNEKGELVKGTREFLLNTRVPAEGELAQIIALRENDNMSPEDIFNLVDYTLTPVPLGTMKGDIPQGQLNAMQQLAFNEARRAQEGLNKDNEDKGESSGTMGDY
jgi:hypothetical protein